MSTKAVGSDHLFLFTDANCLFFTCSFLFNIQCLFIYLFKKMSTKAGGRDDLYLLMQITCCQTWFSFQYSVSIYLFIQNDVNKGRWNRRFFYYHLQRSWAKVMFLHPQLVAGTETRTVGKRESYCNAFLFTYEN